MTDLLIRIIEQPRPATESTAPRAWKSELWSGFPASGGHLLAGGTDTFTQADLEAPLPSGGPGDQKSVLDIVRNQDQPSGVFYEIGLRFHALLEQSGVASAWRHALTGAARTYLQLPEFLEDWPWELLMFPDSLAEPTPAFISSGHPVLRLPRVPLPPAAPWTETTVRILLVSGQEDLDPGNPDKQKTQASVELRKIRKIFQDSNLSVVVDLCEAPTVEALKTRINTMAPHIVHFIAHGDILEDIGFVIEFRQPAPSTAPVQRWAANQIRLFFQDNKVPKPRLVVLNSCNSARREASASPVTHSLIAAGVPAVIGSLAALQIEYARSFSEAFYSSLSKSESIDGAVVYARNAMSGHGDLGGLNRRHWALPVLTARGPVEELLRFKRATMGLKDCEISKLVFRRPGAFVNRTRDRWAVLDALQPNNTTANRFRGVIVFGNSQVGKNWFVMRAMRDFLDSGILVRYATLVSPTASRTSLDVLQDWRGRPGFKSPVLSPPPGSDKDFEAFDAALAKASQPGAGTATNINEVLRAFKAGFQKFRKGRPVLLVLGRFREKGRTNVLTADFRENLLEKLLLPLRNVDAADPETDGLSCVLIVRGQVGMQVDSDFDEFGLNRVSDEVQLEEQRRPQDGFRRLTLSEFAREEGDRHIDEYTQFKDNDEVFNSLRETIKSMVKKGPPTWSPQSLEKFAPAVDFYVGQP